MPRVIPGGSQPEEQYLATPPGPFVVLSLALDSHDGEADLWNLPAETITLCHTLVRMKHEMKRLRQRTGQDFHLFATKENFVRASFRKKMLEELGQAPVDLLFMARVRDLARLDSIRKPSPKDLSGLAKGWRQMVNVDSGQAEPIPEEVQVWGDSWQKCYGWPIREFRYFRPTEARYLRGEHLFYYLNGLPLTSWERFTVKPLYMDSTRVAPVVPDRRILATAKLVHPYLYEIRR
jgi:hypothetical protein